MLSIPERTFLHLPFPPGLRNHLRELPQLPLRDDRPRLFVPGRRPFRSQSHGRGDLWILASIMDDHTFFLEQLVGVFERFFVDGFEVGQVALVI